MKLNCKHKDSSKFLFTLKKNWPLYQNIYKKMEIFNQFVPRPHEKPNYWIKLLKPSIIIKKNDSFGFVFNGRQINCKTDQTFESRPLEPFATEFAKVGEKCNSAIDPLSAYPRATLDDETNKLLRIPKLSLSRNFYYLKGLPKFFTQNLFRSFKNLIWSTTELGWFSLMLVYSFKRSNHSWWTY